MLLKIELTVEGKGFFMEQDREKAARNEVLLSNLRKMWGTKYGYDTIVANGRIGCRFFVETISETGFVKNLMLWVVEHNMTLQAEIVTPSLAKRKPIAVVADMVAAIYSEHEEAADMDAGFDYGEFSGPWHADIAQRKVDNLLEREGYTFDEINAYFNELLPAELGPEPTYNLDGSVSEFVFQPRGWDEPNGTEGNLSAEELAVLVVDLPDFIAP